MKHFSLLILVFFLTACEKSETPAQTYSAYYNRVIEGMAFEDDILHFSKRKKGEIETEMQAAMKSSGATEEQIKKNYSAVSQNFAKCIPIEFVEEEITGKTARVSYKQTDTCNDDANNRMAENLIISMVDEGGWKIDEIDMEFSK